MIGQCASRGKTLEEYCNSKPNGCQLYYTKPNTVPKQFKGFQDAVFVCRARQNGNLEPIKDLPFWAEKAFLIGVGVLAQVQNELNAGDEDDKSAAFGMTGEGDSGAFSAIFKHLQESREQENEETDGF